MSYEFFIVDVFARQKYAGNQLAVVLEAGAIPDAEMQQIAREFNFSETTFVLSEDARDGAWPVRIFTPKRELPFAGHPTLGTAYIIQQHILGDAAAEVTLDLKAGRIPVAFEYDDGRPTQLTMTQLPPTFGATIDAEQMAPVLGLEVGDIDSSAPIQEVSTGFWTIIAPIASLEAQDRIEIDSTKLSELIKPLQAKDIFTFCRQTHDPKCDLNARMFADYYGVPEDPATGSANGCLAGYLVKHRHMGKSTIDVRVEQGVQMGRPSLLHLKAAEAGDRIVVEVGGSVFRVARGKLE